MSKLQPVRGTHDLLPDEYRRLAHVIDAARDVARLYGYREMATPIFEFTELFARGIGETTDVVSKEMYTFTDRGGESLTLRPEYTAGICRAFVSNGAHPAAAAEVLLPRARCSATSGRRRAATASSTRSTSRCWARPSRGADIEVIVGGGRHPRPARHRSTAACSRSTRWATRTAATAYREVLVDYFSGHIGKLSEDSRERLQRNPAAHPRQQGRGRQGDHRRRADRSPTI